MALFDSKQEYLDEIEIVRSQIRRALKGGQSAGVSVAGNSRNHAEIDLDKSRAYLIQLQREYKLIYNDDQIDVRAGF
jgi:hypothetical protein